MKRKRWFLFFFLLASVFLYLFGSLYQEKKREAIDHLNIQQSLHARQAAAGIEDFFARWTANLTVLAGMEPIIRLDATGIKTIDRFYHTNSGKIRAITRVDGQGKIIYTIPMNRQVIGRDISYQKHIREAMQTRKPVVSDVFMAVQGYATVALHVPVFQGEAYQGTIAIAIDIQNLAKRYVEVIKIGRTGYAWLISREGTELYCPVPGHTGKSVFENCKEFPSIIAMAEKMVKGEQGKATYLFDQIGDQAVTPGLKHAVYMPVHVGGSFWSIVVASSEDEVLASLADFRNRLIVIVVLFLLLSGLFFYIGLKAWFILREDEKRRQAEAALKESEEKFRKAFHTSPDSININRLSDGRYVSINEGFSRITGYSEAEIIGRTSVESNVWADPEDRRKLVARLKEHGEVKNLEAAYRMKNGEIRYGLMSAAIIQLQGESHILSVTRDITERRQAQEKLRESRELLAVVFDHVQAGIVLVDPETHTIVRANPMAARMCGVAPEAMAGSLCHRYFCPDASGHCSMTAGRSRIDRVERILVNAEGKEVPVLKDVIAVRIAGKEYLLESFIDLTERKRLEAQLHQAQKMETVGTLAGGIAHDFNNLLTGIQGVASLLMLELDPSHPNYERVKLIEDQVKSGADLTRQLLGFARGGRYEVKPTNINEILAKTAGMFGRTRKEIRIEQNYEEKLWNVEVDQGQMEQAFLNLFMNAWHAMPGGGSIAMTTRNMVLEEEAARANLVEPGRYVQISVADTGVGMDEKTRARIFDPFFTTKGIGRGTGLGLAMVYGIVRGHQGVIGVESEPGRGSTFRISLPASDKAVVPEREVSGKIEKGSETILIVDDETTVLEVSRDMVEALGYRVLTAGSGREAISLYKEKQGEIDLVILDMIMAGMSGGETFDRLRSIHPGVRVLLSSGYRINGQAQEILERGCRGFLQKPFTLQELSKKIREAFDV